MGKNAAEQWRAALAAEKAGQPIPYPSPEPVSTAPVIDPIPAGFTFDKIDLTSDQFTFCTRILSSDALAAIVLDKIRRGGGLSAIRLADGERALIEHSQGKPGQGDGFLTDQRWLKRYGLEGADLKAVGESLLWAAGNSDYCALTISGLYFPAYNLLDLIDWKGWMPGKLIDQFFPEFWMTKERVAPILRAGKTLVLHRYADDVADSLQRRFRVPRPESMCLDSWKDHAAVEAAVAAWDGRLVLVSGGASGKALCVRLAAATGKVVLDVGEHLSKSWAPILGNR